MIAAGASLLVGLAVAVSAHRDLGSMRWFFPVFGALLVYSRKAIEEGVLPASVLALAVALIGGGVVEVVLART